MTGRRGAAAAALAAVIAGAATGCRPGQQLPSFLDRGRLTRVVLNCAGAGRATASGAADNLNELLNELHFGDVLTASRRPLAAHTATPAGAGGCTARLFDGATPAATVVIPAAAGDRRVGQVDLVDPRHPARSGRYRLGRPIELAALTGFIAKYRE